MSFWSTAQLCFPKILLTRDVNINKWEYHKKKERSRFRKKFIHAFKEHCILDRGWGQGSRNKEMKKVWFLPSRNLKSRGKKKHGNKSFLYGAHQHLWQWCMLFGNHNKKSNHLLSTSPVAHLELNIYRINLIGCSQQHDVVGLLCYGVYYRVFGNKMDWKLSFFILVK